MDTQTLREYLYGCPGPGPSTNPNPEVVSRDTLGYVLVNIRNHPEPSETLFERVDVGPGGQDIPGSSSLVHFGP